MATMTESSGRATGSGIVLAGDRTPHRRAAARHSAIVRILKFLLPIGTLGVVAGYGYTIVANTGWGKALEALDVPQIVAENLAMENPHYEGFNNDGGRYWVTARKAMQDLKNLSLIKLETINGELIDAKKQKTRLTATRGTFNNKENIVELYDDIDVAGESGLSAKLTRATIRTKEGVITSDQPVRVAMPAGVITSEQMTIRQKSKEYTFVNKVRTELKGRPSAAANARTTSAMSFASSNEPITISSNRLDVDDTAKTALFTGTVHAVQGEATLTAPEMLVEYEGNAVTPAGDGKPAADGKSTPKPAPVADAQAATDSGKVKKVTAKTPVTLTQGTAQQVTSRTAEFDATTQKAVLEGDVVMTEQPDRRAVGDKAEIDQAAGTVLLTGPVVVSQGKNELRGQRLFVNRTDGKMNLTAPGAGGGRIAARFTQTATPGATAKKAEQPKGMAFSGSFKTDPNAPVDIAATRLDVDDHAKQATFSGDVKAQQAGFNLKAAELVVAYTGAAGFGTGKVDDAAKKDDVAAKLTRIQAKRNVEVTSKEGQTATGDWADYDTRANTVTLGGNVVMTQGKNVVRGTKLVIDMTTGESVISTEAASGAATSSAAGDGSGLIVKSGRPSAVFYPNEIKERAGKALPKLPDGWEARSQPSQ